MYDCPACRTPLHGYEETCPACGTRQAVRRGGGGASRFAGGMGSAEPGINWMPFVITFVVVGIIIAFAIPGSWIGKLMSEGPRKEDPMEKMTYIEARNLIESGLTQGLTTVGAQGKFSWTDPGAGTPVDKNADTMVQLTVDTKLPDPAMRRQIIDPVTQYMEKGKVSVLTMNDEKSHATWTYNMTPAAPVDGGGEEPPAPVPMQEAPAQ